MVDVVGLCIQDAIRSAKGSLLSHARQEVLGQRLEQQQEAAREKLQVQSKLMGQHDGWAYRLRLDCSGRKYRARQCCRWGRARVV